MGLCRPFPQQTFGAQVIRAHDVRQFAFSVNWVRRADLPHILSYGFWASAHPFLSHYLTTCPSVLPNFVAAGSLVCTAWVVRRGFLCKGFLLAILGDGVWGFCGLPMFPYMCFTMCPLFCCCLYILYVIASLCICNCLCLCTFFFVLAPYTNLHVFLYTHLHVVVCKIFCACLCLSTCFCALDHPSCVCVYPITNGNLMSLLVPSQYTHPWRLSFFFPLGTSVGLADDRILSILWPAAMHALVRSLSRPCLRRTFFTRSSIGR